MVLKVLSFTQILFFVLINDVFGELACNICNCLGTTVQCASLGFTDIPDGIPENTTKLDLSGNELVELSEAEVSTKLHLPQLRTLDLSNNKLSEFPVNTIGLIKFGNSTVVSEYIQNATSSICAEYKLSSLASNLQLLNLANNQLTHLEENSFILAPKLVALHLESNLLANIEPKTVAGLCSLTTLSLQDNNLIEVGRDSFIGLNKLQTLTLQGNSIKLVEEGAFRELFDLEHINLSNNDIGFLHPSVFITNLSLTTIYLFDNNIKYLDWETIGLLNLIRSQLEVFELLGNPLSESCDNCHTVNVEFTRIADNGVRSAMSICVSKTGLSNCFDSRYPFCDKSSGFCVQNTTIDYVEVEEEDAKIGFSHSIHFSIQLTTTGSSLLLPRTFEQKNAFIEYKSNEIQDMLLSCGHAIEEKEKLQLLWIKECTTDNLCNRVNGSQILSDGVEMGWIVNAHTYSEIIRMETCIKENAAKKLSHIRENNFHTFVYGFEEKEEEEAEAEYDAGFYVSLTLVILGSLVLLAGLYVARHQAKRSLKRVHTMAAGAVVRVASMSPKKMKRLIAAPSFFVDTSNDPELKRVLTKSELNEDELNPTELFLRRYFKNKYKGKKSRAGPILRGISRRLLPGKSRKQRIQDVPVVEAKPIEVVKESDMPETNDAKDGADGGRNGNEEVNDGADGGRNETSKAKDATTVDDVSAGDEAGQLPKLNKPTRGRATMMPMRPNIAATPKPSQLPPME